jgi:hypothetical protein
LNFKHQKWVCHIFKVLLQVITNLIMSQTNFHAPPRGCLLKRKLNMHAGLNPHVRNNFQFVSGPHPNLLFPAGLPQHNLPRNDHSLNQPPMDFGGEGEQDEFADYFSDGSDHSNDSRRSGNSTLHHDVEEDEAAHSDDGEHLNEREEPVDEDDTNIADLMAQSSLDDFNLADLSKDEEGNFVNNIKELIFPRVLIMVSITSHLLLTL